MSSDFLFADPSFLSGLARIGDIAGQFDRYNMSRTPEEADYRAMLADWAVVGETLRLAIAQFEAMHPEVVSRANTAPSIEAPAPEQLSLPLSR